MLPILPRTLLLLALSVTLALAQGANNKYAGLQCDDPAFTPSERAGCYIWFYATAGNGRFHTYVFQQRMGVLIDWYRVLNAPERKDRFKAWGLMNDPGCCTPGSPNCPAKSLDQTYGFDWCPGDEKLLEYVGKPGYRDPACDFKDAPLDPKDTHGPKDQRESACGLEFGTSTGAMGLRKFPNPRFDAVAWRKLNGSLGTWKGYNARLANPRMSKLLDGSVEPPFLVGMSCGACHIAFDPLNPPKDPSNPALANLIGAIGNQYSRSSEIMASGMSRNSAPWQVFAHARPGTVDTSAVPTDQVNNAGTMNALLNLEKRPTFENEEVDKWRKVKSCAAGANDRTCWCEPGRDGKCWQRSIQKETVHHILKGGEDSIGALEALQRVYFNIGSCSEPCWVNHLTNLRQLDPFQRGFGQTPFDIGQCRRDCPNLRAIEDRLLNIRDYLFSQRPNDLYAARKLANPRDLIEQLDREFGAGSVERGRTVFAENCAKCHSSQKGNLATRDFHVKDAKGVREDWMGNEEATLVTEVGTYRARALHTNHMTGHLWQEYGSNTLRARKPDPNVAEPGDGGRGYYRNISLLSLWAHAPFMHNNAIGPELCGQPANKENDFYSAPYLNADLTPMKNPPPCWPFDPSVEGRYKLFKASVDELLNPGKRIPKAGLLDRDIIVDVGPKMWDPAQKQPVGLVFVIPAGLPAATVGNLQHKQLIDDLVLAKTNFDKLKAARGDAAAAEIRDLADEVLRDPLHVLKVAEKHRPLIRKLYMGSTAVVENEGHRFGESLPDRDKKALTAFLATL